MTKRLTNKPVTCIAFGMGAIVTGVLITFLGLPTLFVLAIWLIPTGG